MDGRPHQQQCCRLHVIPSLMAGVVVSTPPHIQILMRQTHSLVAFRTGGLRALRPSPSNGLYQDVTRSQCDHTSFEDQFVSFFFLFWQQIGLLLMPHQTNINTSARKNLRFRFVLKTAYYKLNLQTQAAWPISILHARVCLPSASAEAWLNLILWRTMTMMMQWLLLYANHVPCTNGPATSSPMQCSNYIYTVMIMGSIITVLFIMKPFYRTFWRSTSCSMNANGH